MDLLINMKYLTKLTITIIISNFSLIKAQNLNPKIEKQIDSILSNMTIKEKIGQLALSPMYPDKNGDIPQYAIEGVKNGNIGGFINVTDTLHIKQLQKIAIEKSNNGIPLLFSRDVIHGYNTIFPIPLGQAASWNPDVVETGSRIAAIEASSHGIKWTFAPMLDISQDARWGRIAESPGEDPYLASVLSKAYITGFQTNDMSNPTAIAACAKHFLAYGAAEGGRDYNAVTTSNELLRNLYLPPFKAAAEANAATFMSSFNDINGVPASGNKRILTDILRGDYKFDGFVVSDWESINEMRAHGFAQNQKNAAEISAKAGLDMEMTSKTYENHLEELINEGKINISQLDFYVKNILRIKLKLNLFEKPYLETSNIVKSYLPQHLNEAKKAAVESSVLLKNNGVLPLKSTSKLLLTGPLAHQEKEQLGTWSFDGEAEPTVTPHEALKNITFVEGLKYSRDYNTSEFKKVIKNAKKSDVIIFVGGEEAILSGEAHSRANIKLPGAQNEFLDELLKLNKQIVLVIMAGRPVNITKYVEKVDAILMMWHPGTMGGPALKEILYGESEPSGRLPVTWPKAAGQTPIYYNHKNTGRPAKAKSYVQIDKIKVGAPQTSLGNQSHYLDLGYKPLFNFGYGLGYGTTKLTDFKVSTNELNDSNSIDVSVSITNTSNISTTEVVQLYAHDLVGRLTRPVLELKRFKKVNLDPNSSKVITFKLSKEDFKYYDNEDVFDVELGEIELLIGKNSNELEKISIYIK